MILGNGNHIARYALHPTDLAFNYRFWHRASIQNQPFVFILGVPRSGTTLVHRMLLNHPQIEGFSEETSILSPKSVRNLDRFSHMLDHETLRTVLRASTDIADFFTRVHASQFADMPDCLYYVEKTPQNIRRLRFILEYFPESKVLHLIRDVRDAYCSARATKFIPRARNARLFAKYWRSCIDIRNSHSSSRILDVHYEHISSSPAEILSRIMKFLNLEPFHEAQLSDQGRRNDPRSERSEFSRLGEPINDASVGRWRQELLPREIQTFRKYAGRTLISSGYEL